MKIGLVLENIMYVISKSKFRGLDQPSTLKKPRFYEVSYERVLIFFFFLIMIPKAINFHAVLVLVLVFSILFSDCLRLELNSSLIPRNFQMLYYRNLQELEMKQAHAVNNLFQMLIRILKMKLYWWIFQSLDTCSHFLVFSRCSRF